MPWLLGSSEQSAIWAGELGLPYAFADFINPQGAEIAALYRERFAGPGPQGARTAVAAWVLCAPTDEEAEFLASSSRMTFTMLRRGQLIAVPPPEQAVEFLAREARLSPSGGPRPARRSSARPRRCAPESSEVATEYLADEVIVVTITYDQGAPALLRAAGRGVRPRAPRPGHHLGLRS